MVTRISPFLEKKFFEYVDQVVAKKVFKNFQFICTSTNSLDSIIPLIHEKADCIFVSIKERGRRRVSLYYIRDLSKILEEVCLSQGQVELYFGDGGASISVDKDDELLVADIAAWGSFLENFEGLQATLGANFKIIT